MVEQKETFTMNINTYKDQILQIGVKLVKNTLIRLNVIHVLSLILKFIYEGSELYLVAEMLGMGVIVTVILGIQIFVINTNLNIFRTILTYFDIFSVVILTEIYIKKSPQDFQINIDVLTTILCTSLLKQMIMASSTNRIYGNVFNIAYYFIRNHMQYGNVPVDIRFFLVYLLLITVQSSLLIDQYVQKMIELMIKDSENMKTQFKNTLEIIPNGVLVFNVNSEDVVFSNSELFSLFSIDSKDDIKETLKTFMLSFKTSNSDQPLPAPSNNSSHNQKLQDDKNIKQNLLEYLLSIKSQQNNKESLFKSKTLQKYVQVKAQFIDKDSQLIVIINDISRIKQIEKVSQQMKSMFFASIAHELRTPLNTIIPMSNRLIEQIPSGKSLQYILIIRNSAVFLQNIVEEALDMSRLENNKFVINNELFDIRKTIEAVADVMEFQVQQKKLKFQIDISDNVPDQIASDEKRYQQILYNLIGNALKFTFKGYIKLSVDYVNNFLITVVEDSGIGIEQEQISKLFKFFGTIQKSNKINRGGMGFGLTISKMILQQLNGDISVESQQSQGSKFTFSIKIEQASRTSLNKDLQLKRLNISEQLEIEPDTNIPISRSIMNEEQKQQPNNKRIKRESYDFAISPEGSNSMQNFEGLEDIYKRYFTGPSPKSFNDH